MAVYLKVRVGDLKLNKPLMDVLSLPHVRQQASGNDSLK